ncbi:MAG: hypothetical protein NC548_63195 [Lachnospiraceae bacterium]|nr:hypothetical protein [Lachnospiraceae bacterium]
MKSELSIDKSARLIELGVDPSKASGVVYTDPYGLGDAIEPKVFTLTDILSILPKWIKHRHYLCYLEMGVDRYSEAWFARYASEHGVDEADSFQCSEELIDCLYNLLVWLLEEGHGIANG